MGSLKGEAMKKALWMCVLFVVVLAVLTGQLIRNRNIGSYNEGWRDGYTMVYQWVKHWTVVSNGRPIVLEKKENGITIRIVNTPAKFPCYFESGTTAIEKGDRV